jgi:hypothetical protein
MPRRLLLLLAALAALALVSVSPAFAASGAQTRVRASTPTVQDHTGLTALGSSCSRPGSATGFAKTAAGFCVATLPTAVMGRQADTAVAQDWAGHEVLNLPTDKWSIEANGAWVKSVADRGMDAYTASPLSSENPWDAEDGRETVYARELRQLTEQYGYQWDEDTLRPPG